MSRLRSRIMAQPRMDKSRGPGSNPWHRANNHGALWRRAISACVRTPRCLCFAYNPIRGAYLDRQACNRSSTVIRYPSLQHGLLAVATLKHGIILVKLQLQGPALAILNLDFSNIWSSTCPVLQFDDNPAGY